MSENIIPEHITSSNIVNKLTNQLRTTLSNEDIRAKKFNKLEEQINKMQNYLLRPENIQTVDECGDMTPFIRKGETRELVQKSLDSSQDSGGVTITPGLNRKIINIIEEKSVMRQLGRIEKITTKTLDFICEDGAFNSGWVAENANRESTQAPNLKKQSIATHELYAQPKATQSLINDAEINIEEWLIDRIADSFIKLENQAFINGDGNNKPTGLLQNTDITEIEFGNNVSAERLLQLINQLEEGYLANAAFLMNRNSLTVIQSLKDATGRFIWNQSLSDPLSQTIFGIPVFISSHMPDIAENKPSIALGDFKSGYCIVDRQHIHLMRDPFTEKPYVKFYAVKRVGGDVTNSKAIKFAKFVT